MVRDPSIQIPLKRLFKKGRSRLVFTPAGIGPFLISLAKRPIIGYSSAPYSATSFCRCAYFSFASCSDLANNASALAGLERASEL